MKSRILPTLAWLVVWSGASTGLHAQPAYDQADAAYKSENYETAAGLLEGFVAANPDDPAVEEARYTLGRCYDRLNKYADAARAYKGLLDQHPATPRAEEARFQLAHAYRELRDWPAAVAGYQDFIAHHPESSLKSDAEWAVIQCYFETGQYDALSAYAEQIFAENPQHPYRAELIFLQGRMLQDRGNYDQAIDNYMEYLGSSDAAVNDKRALLFLGKAMFKQAEVLGWRDQPTTATGGLSAPFLAEQGKNYLRLLVDREDLNPEDRAWAMWLTGEYNKLEEFSASVVAAHPENDRARIAMQVWMGIGQLQKSPQDRDGAKATFEAVMNADAHSFPDMTPEQAGEHIARATGWRIFTALYMDNDQADAQRFLEKLRSEVPDNSIKTDVLRMYGELGSAYLTNPIK